MSRSQMHRVRHLNYASDGKALAEGAAAPGYVRQLPGPFVVPMGPAGGPLQGSSLSGPAPATIPSPQLEHPLLVLGVVLAAGQKPPEPPPAADQSSTERSFPIGPIALDQVSFDETDGELQFQMSEDPAGPFAEVDVGDTVRVEATGNSSVNGDYTVASISDPRGTFWVAAADPGNGPIVGKGRVTIIGGA